MERLAALQETLFADNRYGVLLMFQALDAAGKDGTIRAVLTGVNPSGTQVFSFKAPDAEELDHDFLWRCSRCAPERGRIGIFNRSYYEEVLVVRVHPELLARQHLPPQLVGENLWRERFEHINNYERYLAENGTLVLKFFLNVSKEEQKKRFLERIDRPEKNWKFSDADVRERQHWDEYQAAYEDCLNQTSTKHAPWYVIPADRKWFARICVAAVVCKRMDALDLTFPTLSEEHRRQLKEARRLLESET